MRFARLTRCTLMSVRIPCTVRLKTHFAIFPISCALYYLLVFLPEVVSRHISRVGEDEAYPQRLGMGVGLDAPRLLLAIVAALEMVVRVGGREERRSRRGADRHQRHLGDR